MFNNSEHNGDQAAPNRDALAQSLDSGKKQDGGRTLEFSMTTENKDSMKNSIDDEKERVAAQMAIWAQESLRVGGDSDNYSAGMKIEKSSIRYFIGFENRNVQKLDDDFHVTIRTSRTIPILGIFGNHRRNVDDAYEVIESQMWDQNQSAASMHIKCINIDANDIKLIMGNGEEFIKQMETKYGVQMHVNTTTSRVTITGENVAVVQNALNNMQTFIKENNANDLADVQDDSDLGACGYTENATNNNNDDGQENNANDAICFGGLADWAIFKERAEATGIAIWLKNPPLKKHKYEECAEVTALTEQETERMLFANNKIILSRICNRGISNLEDFPKPIWKFEHCFAKYPNLLNDIKKQGFQKPTPIQMEAWPVLLKGEDLIGIAQTGAGKTLAFLLPALIFTHLQTAVRSDQRGPYVIILAPTRELVVQIEREVKKYSFRQIRIASIFGGAYRRSQIQSVENGVDIIIGTPGRVEDLVQCNVINLKCVGLFILDEADLLLDSSTEPMIQIISSKLRKDHQTVMSSATWNSKIHNLALDYMQNPIQVFVSAWDYAATSSVQQYIQIIDDEDKPIELRRFIHNLPDEHKVIIFCGRKAGAEDLTNNLRFEGIPAQCVHGNRTQFDREKAIYDIRNGVVNILIATDVIARGADIAGVTHVVNYDMPYKITGYLHRLGYTGRAGRTGTCLSFMTSSNWNLAGDLIDILQGSNQEVPQQLRSMARRYEAMKAREAFLCPGFGLDFDEF